jgi:hypothetical protein
MARGQWPAFEQRLAQGLACIARADAEDALPSEEALDAAATAFRYDRDLIAAADVNRVAGADRHSRGRLDRVPEPGSSSNASGPTISTTFSIASRRLLSNCSRRRLRKASALAASTPIERAGRTRRGRIRNDPEQFRRVVCWPRGAASLERGGRRAGAYARALAVDVGPLRSPRD